MALLNVAATTNNPKRDVAIVTMLVETGARLGEIVGMPLTRVHIDKRYVLISGKTGERFSFFEEATQYALREWMNVRPASMKSLFGLGETGVRRLKCTDSWQPNG